MAADWRTMVRDAVAVKAADVKDRNRGASNVAHISRVGFSAAVHPYLVRAAKLRGISISGYIRRATMAHVAMDLGVSQFKLFEEDTAITPIGRRGAPPSRDLDGMLYGRWGVGYDAGTDGEPD